MQTLPIVAHLEEISRAIAENPVVLLSSPPGTGKTTLLPPYLLQINPSRTQRIAMLEPRRIAAVRTAEFISQTTQAEIIGYRVRGASNVSSKTLLEIQTYGVFNRIAASTPDLPSYDLIIFDEAHERSIDIDLAFAQAIEIQRSLRPDLKILIMSATLNVDDFRRIVPQAPLISVQAVTYPVETSYLPPSASEERNLSAHVVRAVRSVNHRAGDILIFLPGAAEINKANEALEEAHLDREIVKLSGELSLNEQRRILSPNENDRDRIVLASAIAETSLTVPRIHTVIDGGFSRVPRFDPERGIPGLATVRVSSATAEQRTGRAARLGPGICLRLWEAHEALVRFRSPEIMESDLAPLLLTLAAAGVTDFRTLNWLTPPSSGSMMAARDLLISLGAVDDTGRITEQGALMQAFPVHPRLAHMVTVAAFHGEAERGARIAAAWSEMRPQSNRPTQNQAALGKQSQFTSNVIDLSSISRDLPSVAQELAKDLMRIVKHQKPFSKLESSSSQNALRLSDALLFVAAFPDRIAQRKKNGEYLLSGGPRAALPPQSSFSREEFLICPAVRNRAGSNIAIISAAGIIAEQELRAAYPQLFIKKSTLAWNDARQAVVNRATETLGAIEFSSHESPCTDQNSAQVLLQHISFKDLPIADRTNSLIERAQWLHKSGFHTASEPLWFEQVKKSDLSWLTNFIPGASRLSDISEDAVHNAIVAFAGGSSALGNINRLAPESIALPKGRPMRLTYSANRAPVASSRLQDFFGVKKHPTVADGKVAVICELLSPAKRPVQITDDLPRFWTGSYASVRKELKNRYPKHDWPEKP